MSEDRLHEANSKAAQARDLLGNEMLAEGYERIEADLIAAWISSPARDQDGRERAWHAVQANRKHRAYLQSVVDNGKIAQAELNELIAKEERKRGLLRFR